jgi:hypothetical protein
MVGRGWKMATPASVTETSSTGSCGVIVPTHENRPRLKLISSGVRGLWPILMKSVLAAGIGVG